jgi:hypothetical protein
VAVANESNFDFERTNAFSGCAWINLDNPARQQAIISKMGNTSPFTGWEFTTNNSGNIILWLINDATTNYIEVSAPVLTANRWYHVCFTYTGSGTASGAKIFIDGSLPSVSTGSNTLSATILNDQPVNSGRRSGGTRQADGLIDDVRIYNRALSADEIKRLYTMGR